MKTRVVASIFFMFLFFGQSSAQQEHSFCEEALLMQEAYNSYYHQLLQLIEEQSDRDFVGFEIGMDLSVHRNSFSFRNGSIWYNANGNSGITYWNRYVDNDIVTIVALKLDVENDLLSFYIHTFLNPTSPNFQLSDFNPREFTIVINCND